MRTKRVLQSDKNINVQYYQADTDPANVNQEIINNSSFYKQAFYLFKEYDKNKNTKEAVSNMFLKTVQN